VAAAVSQVGDRAAEPARGLDVIPDRVSVQLAASVTPQGAATRDAGSGGPILTIGGDGTAYLLAGRVDREGRPSRALCTARVGSGDLGPEAVAKAAHVWRAKLSVLSATMQSIVLGVDWSRESVDSLGVRRNAAGDRTTLTLREGEHHTLDFIASTAPGDDCGESLRVDVTATIAEDRRFADERIRYELWLVDQAPGRPDEVRQFVATAEHGEKLDFGLDALRWGLPGAIFKNGTDAQAVAVVRGSIRGRIREDGSIEILLGAMRDLGIAEAGKTSGGRVSEGGEKALRIAPGETLGLILPRAGGAHTLALDESWSTLVGAPGMTSAGSSLPGPGGGLDIDSERVTVDFGKFLAAHTMSLRLTASRVSH